MGDVYPRFKVASIQAASVYLDREKTAQKACSLIREAGSNGAKIIAFPEGFLPGHPYWYYFYPVQASESIEFYKTLFKNAVEVPSPTTEMLGQAARDAQAYVVIGICEKEKNTLGTLYNTYLFFDPNGQIVGKHRKIVPTSFERLVHGRGDGSGLRVVETPYGSLGALICGENTSSLARFTLLALGEKIHVAGWPAFIAQREQYNKEAIDFRTRSHAYEGKIFVINSMGVLTKDTINEICPDIDCQKKYVNIVSDGGHSSIIGPRGEFLAGPLESGEGILYAEVDYNQSIVGKMLHDVTGHYGRFDIFQLHVNRSSYKTVNASEVSEMEPCIENTLFSGTPKDNGNKQTDI